MSVFGLDQLEKVYGQQLAKSAGIQEEFSKKIAAAQNKVVAVTEEQAKKIAEATRKEVAANEALLKLRTSAAEEAKRADEDATRRVKWFADQLDRVHKEQLAKVQEAQDKVNNAQSQAEADYYQVKLDKANETAQKRVGTAERAVGRADTEATVKASRRDADATAKEAEQEKILAAARISVADAARNAADAEIASKDAVTKTSLEGVDALHKQEEQVKKAAAAVAEYTQWLSVADELGKELEDDQRDAAAEKAAREADIAEMGKRAFELSDKEMKEHAERVKALADEQKKAITEVIDLEKQRVDSLDAQAKTIRETLQAGQAASEGITSFSRVLSHLLRGDIAGALSGLAGIGQKAKSTQASKIEAAANKGARAISAGNEITGVPGANVADVQARMDAEGKRTSRFGLPSAAEEVQKRQQVDQQKKRQAALPEVQQSPVPQSKSTPSSSSKLDWRDPWAVPPSTPAQVVPPSPSLAPVQPVGKTAPSPGAAAQSASTSAAGTANSAVSAIGGGLGGLAAGAAAALGPIAAVAMAAKELGGVMLSLAGAASPVQMERFQMALDDSQAVLGRVFVPVLELATDGVRLVGDALLAIIPDMETMRNVLSPWKDVLEEMRDVLSGLAPLLKPLITFLAQLSKWIFYIMNAIPLLILKGASLLSKTFGAKGLPSSVGAATKQASYTSVDAYLKQSYANAFSIGLKKDYSKETAENTKEIADALKKKFGQPDKEKSSDTEEAIRKARAHGLYGGGIS